MKIIVAVLAVAAALQPTFSTRVEGVRVDVLVTDSSRRPLRGLTRRGFHDSRQRHPQEVDVVSFGEISLNVGLTFDLSESVAGARLEQLKAASQALTAELAAGRSVGARDFRYGGVAPVPALDEPIVRE